VVVQREEEAMFRRMVIALVLALLSSGCATKAYEGPELPKSKIAILNTTYTHTNVFAVVFPVPAAGHKHATSVREIDTTEVRLTRYIHILPGSHTAKVNYWRYPAVKLCIFAIISIECVHNYFSRDLSIDFTAKAGHEYRIPAERRGERNWIWVEDITESKTNGKVVVEVVAGEKPPAEKGK